ncbi:MAG: 4Fe-4S binding protein, partial [Bacteroidales bacterium]|nr:4Fe-4S binding protein [Bacteroidales bacterium]
ACNAACILENGLQPGTRSIYTWNGSGLPLMSVISLSLACNHCEKPACAEGCPAQAYTIEDDGVVIHHADLCMGCGYCTWKCPYDAPKINRALGYIEKCHFCADRAVEGLEPACVTACPTGALKMTGREHYDGVMPAWFPETGIGPSLIIKNADRYTGPEIIPAETGADDEEETDPDHDEDQITNPDRIQKEWSLILFSLMVISASALMVFTALTGTVVSGLLPLLLLAGAMAVSVAHLGVPGKAWRALLNIVSSPLSREIAMVGILAGIAILNWISPGLIAPVIVVIASLLTLISIDMVFFAADRSFSLKLHSGQAFFSGIYAVSWFIKPDYIFLVFSMLAALSVVMRYESTGRTPLVRNLYYFRAMSLPLVFLLVYPGTPLMNTAALVLFMAGVVADRVLFYYDFNPVNIKETITEHLNTEYEKERDKQRKDSNLS